MDGRDLRDFGWYVFVFVNIDDDGTRAREEAARFLGGNYDQDFRAMLDRVAAAGTADEVTNTLSAFVDAGVRHFVFTPAAPAANHDHIVRCLLDEVIPAVRERAHDY